MASNNITISELQKLCNKFSIKNFLTDLPRMLNEAFTVIYECITGLYNPDEGSVRCNKIDATYIDATTIVAQNLRFKGPDGVMYNYNDIGQVLADMENRLEGITNITKSQIDSLEILPFQPWPLYADCYMITPENPINGCILLTQNGISVYDADSDTWIDKRVVDGVIYLCDDNKILYKRDNENNRWIDMGSYEPTPEQRQQIING